MRVRILMEIVGDDGSPCHVEELAVLNKQLERAEDIGLTLSESKALLGSLQQRLVTVQAEQWFGSQRQCRDCGRQRRIKGSYPIVFHTLFGDVRLASRRLFCCRCRGGQAEKSSSPLAQLLPDHVAPERLYLETRWSSLVSYAAAAELLSDVLPVTAGANASTTRRHVLRVAKRIETELPEACSSLVEGNLSDLPLPGGRMFVGLDGGYLRDWSEKKSNFEVIVGRSIPQAPEDGTSRYLGFVHGYDQNPKRRLVSMLESQGVQANQDITFLTDGGEEICALTERISPCSEHVLDWFHIAMRLTVLNQYAKGVAQYDEETGASLIEVLARIKWKLWHGNTIEARETIEDLEADVSCLDTGYPNEGKFFTAMREFAVYIASNAASLVNYGERYRSGERISSAFVEATVNAVVSKRFAKKQQMQWTRRGAHLLLQTRTRTLDGTLRSTFQRWYPNMSNGNAPFASNAIAA